MKTDINYLEISSNVISMVYEGDKVKNVKDIVKLNGQNNYSNYL